MSNMESGVIRELSSTVPGFAGRLILIQYIKLIILSYEGFKKPNSVSMFNLLLTPVQDTSHIDRQ